MGIGILCSLLALPLRGQVKGCQVLTLSFPIIGVEGIVSQTSGPWMGGISITQILLGMQIFIFLIFFFLWLHPWHMEVPRLRAESELELLAYAIATATWDLGQICDLHCSLWHTGSVTH